jgi:hypothetical protein
MDSRALTCEANILAREARMQDFHSASPVGGIESGNDGCPAKDWPVCDGLLDDGEPGEPPAGGHSS